MARFRRRGYALAAVVCLAASPGASTGAPCADANGSVCPPTILEEVVVTGTRTNMTLLRTPLTMSVVDAATLARSTADTLAELLRDLPGVSVSDAGQAGMRRVRFRGEESRRIAVLIDGQELTDHREVGVPLLIDPALVDRIEVVRGPASVLYGAKALGGVVNVITRKGGERGLEGSLSTTYSSATHGLHTAASLRGTRGEYGYRLFMARNDQGERHTPAGEIESTAYASDSIALHASRSFGPHYLALAFDRHRADAEVYVAPEVRFTFPFLDFAIDVPQRDRRKGSLFYEGRPVGETLKKVQFNAYRQVADRRFNTASEMLLPFPPPGLHIDSEIATTSALTTDGALVQLDWQPAESHYLIGGLQYTRDRVIQHRLKETSTNFGVPSIERINDEARITTAALYLQDEWSLPGPWSIVAGLRDYRVEGSLEATDRPLLARGSRDDEHLVASASLLYAASADTTLRLTLADGYVYPSLLQLATGAYAGSRFINPNLELEPETSGSIEFGLRHQGAKLRFDGTLFTSHAKDYIDHLRCRAGDDCLTPTDEIYRNIGSSRAFGLEIEAGYLLPREGLDTYTNLAWYRRRNEHEGLTTYKSGLPKLAGRTGVRYRTSLGRAELAGDLYLRYESSAEELDITDARATPATNDSWHTINVDLAIDFAGPVRADLSLVNLGDRKYSAATENLYAAERSLAVKITLAL